MGLKLRARMSNYILHFYRDVITYPYPDIKGGLAKPLLKLGLGE